MLYDTVLTGAMTQEAVDRCEKQLRSHSRGFHRALAKLEELQVRRQEAEAGEIEIPPNPFATELACEALLGRKIQGRQVPLPALWFSQRPPRQQPPLLGVRRLRLPDRVATRHRDGRLAAFVDHVVHRDLALALAAEDHHGRAGVRARDQPDHDGAQHGDEDPGGHGRGECDALMAGLDTYYTTCRTGAPEPGVRPQSNSSPSNASPC